MLDAMELGDDAYRYVAQLPRRHFYYGDGQDRDLYDSLLLHEVLRQAGISSISRCLTDSSNKTLIDSSKMRVLCLSSLEIGPEPAEVVVDLRNDGSQRRHLVKAVGAIAGRPVVEIEMVGRSISSQAYHRMRQSSLAEPSEELPRNAARPRCEPARVGRGSRHNVVIGQWRQEGGKFSATLVEDARHPVFFDHAVDHLPASLLIEAVRQAGLYAVSDRYALAPSHGVLVEWSACFERFAEFGPATTLTVGISDPEMRAGIEGATQVRCEASVAQGGRVVATMESIVAYPRRVGA